MLVPLARLARRGEAIRIGAVRNRPTSRRPREPRVGRRGWRALARDRPAAWPAGRAPRAATGSPIRCAPQGAGPCQPAAARPRPWPAEASKSNAEARGLTGRELPSHWPCSLTRATRGSVKLTRRKSTQKPRARIGRVMPIYEYECHGCRRRVSLLVLRPSAAEPPTCPKCGSSALSRLRSPFLSWTWQCEWSRTFADDRRLEIRCVEDRGGNLVALLPLYESAPGSLQIIGGADVSDYLDLIAVRGREEEAWMALLQSRTAEPVEWALHAVPEASPTVTALPPLAAACGLDVS